MAGRGQLRRFGFEIYDRRRRKIYGYDRGYRHVELLSAPSYHDGEGGAVYTNNPLLGKIVRSFRDWGRDCSCPSGTDNLCKHRFDRQYGELPLGYDHKYVYSHFGYNLKATDMQAAIGCAQIKRIEDFAVRRRHNFARLKAGLAECQDKIILPGIVSLVRSQLVWFSHYLPRGRGRLQGGGIYRSSRAYRPAVCSRETLPNIPVSMKCARAGKDIVS